MDEEIKQRSDTEKSVAFLELLTWLCPAVFMIFIMAMVGISILRQINATAALDEQRYECRVSGGNLEHFGERGWVCIKPKN